MNFQLFSILSQLGSLRQFGISDVDYLRPFQGPGHLGLPRPAIERVDSSHTFDTRAFRLFSEFSRVRDSMAELLPRLTDTPAFAGQPLLATLLSDFATSNEQLTAHFSEIRADPRVVALNGVMISTGSGATVFEESRLKLWYVWCANEFGPQAANEHLSRWLDAQDVEVVAALWVHGLDVDEEIQLADGYCITPAQQLPESTHKEQALQFKMPALGHVVSYPTAAITRICRVRKTRGANEMPDRDRDSDFWNAQQRLYDTAIVLNTLPGITCLPAFATS